MHCRCPACHRTMPVANEQLDFLVRCERCKAMFIARTAETVEQIRRLAAQAPDDSADLAPAPLVHLAELLSRSSGNASASLAPALPLTSTRLRQKQLRRFQLRWRRHALGVIGLCGILVLLILTLCILLLKSHAFPQSAHANVPATPIALSPAPVPLAPKVHSTSVAPTPTPVLSSADDSAGELFPDVKPEH